MIATETKNSKTTRRIETKLPKLNMPLPGPNAKRIVEAGCEVGVAVVHARLSAGGQARLWRDGRGRRRQHVSGFCRGHRGLLDRALPSAMSLRRCRSRRANCCTCRERIFITRGCRSWREKLSAIAPGKEPKRVYFGNSGAEAVEAAIKLAKYHTRRDKIIAFEGAFHGRTMGALSLTASKSTQRKGFGTLISGVFHMPYPDTYRGMYGKGAETVVADCLGYLENELFKRRVDPEEVAGIFIEPIQGEGGYMPAPVEFLKGLQAICRKYGIMLVADEVQSGMGRTGKWWASDHAGIEPDIICTAKGIASGMPLSAVIARESVMNWKPGAHASTFGGNPVCIAASLATIELLESKYIKNAERVGEYIMKRTADWTQKYKSVGNVRGRGLMIGIEMVKDQKTKEKAPELRNRIIDAAYHKGLLILGSGENTVRFCPPLVIDEEQAEFAVATLGELLEKEAK